MNINRQINSSQNVQKYEGIVRPLFDIKTLDFYCRYIISANQNIRISGLNLIKDLFDKINPDSYGNDIERINRIVFIKRGLEARISKKLNDRDMIIQYINGGPLDKPLLDTSIFEEISDEMLAYLNEQAGELAKSYFVDDKYEQIFNLATNLKNSNYSRRSEVVDKIQALASEMNMQFNKMDEAAKATSMFSLVPGEFETAMSDTYARETSPSRILKTGIVGLNLMLNGGFQSNRVYILFAQAAGGKSFTMIDLAMQIKKHNKDYIPHDPTKIPTIVFLTMENSSDENISRMMGMISGKTFNDYDLDQSIDIFRNNGLGYSPENDPIDIVMIYKPNLSINTDYLYTIVDKLREMGREPICVFQDHIKRIRPTNKRNELRLDLGEIVNEFKAFANATNIPVITDSHLNRDAAKTIDESSSNGKGGENKKDLIRSLGSGNVSESFLMIDNCDVGIIINKEEDSFQNKYMGFKCIKTRTKCTLDLFYQPYVLNNDIKLIEDNGSVSPVYRTSLKEDTNIKVQTKQFSRRYDIDEKDDDDLFTENTMGAISRSVDNILLPDNNNQSSFVISGAPSVPIYPMPPVHNNIFSNNPFVQSQDWQQELIRRKYNNEGTVGFYFMDENNELSIGDSVSGIENIM